MSTFRPIAVFAPAKINLYLHIIRRRDDGFHDLDSLVTFADIGDRISIEPAQDFSMRVIGPYAGRFTAQETDSSARSSNLVARAAWAMADAARRPLQCRITLAKSLPLAAGIGGGSADAAATIWGLMNIWNIPANAPWLMDVMSRLGADVPACLRCAPVRMEGIGDVLEPAGDLPEIPVVLVNPNAACPTPQVFARFAGPMRGRAAMPARMEHMDDVLALLKKTDNDLTPAACEIAPDITIALRSLEQSRHCALARMSGSGATCFGLFPTMEDATQAAQDISLSNPKWWVRTGTLNSPQRY